MRVQKLRGLPDMAATYPAPHDHRIYGHGHHVRIEVTKALARWHGRDCAKAADLSCGNGEVLANLPMEGTYGDFAPGWPIQGPIDETLKTIDHVDIFLCNETLEHLEHPAITLCAIREKASKLILSTPVDAWDDSNGEHLWAWDREFVEVLLHDSGWHVDGYASFDSRPLGEPYNYGMWAAS